MNEKIVYREMRPGEEQTVCDLVGRVFDACIADEFGDAGATEFFRFANPDVMKARMGTGGLVFLAIQSVKPLGMLEFVPPDRIAMMFVELRRQGIAKASLEHAIHRVRGDRPEARALTVHASLQAESIYRKMGFYPTGDATTENGITYVPMERDI